MKMKVQKTTITIPENTEIKYISKFKYEPDKLLTALIEKESAYLTNEIWDSVQKKASIYKVRKHLEKRVYQIAQKYAEMKVGETLEAIENLIDEKLKQK